MERGILGMIFFSITVCLIVLGKYYSRRITTTEKIIQFVFPILYDTARVGGIGAGFVLRGMSLSYIPFRLLMILTASLRLCLVPVDSNRGYCLVEGGEAP